MTGVSANLPMAYGARGKFSEIATETFAIRMLREYRRGTISVRKSSEKVGS
jgi:hypothetical protein